MAYAKCEGCQHTLDLKKNHVVTTTGYKHSPNCGETPKPLEAAPQTGSPGPATGNPVWELASFACWSCHKVTYVQNAPEIKYFGADKTDIRCAFCGEATHLTASFHVEPLWKMEW